jgi:hypothetical protein
MTKSTRPARPTPFTGGAALALLILGLVVHPIQAGTLECRQCQYKWRSNGPDAAAACAGKTGMALSYCLSGMAYEKCVRPHPPADSICLPPPPPGGPVYTDCASDACSGIVPCGINESTTYCTNFCSGCNNSGNNCNLLLIIPPPIKITVSPCYNYCGCGSTP